MKYTAKQRAALKRMPAGRRAGFRRMLAAAGYRANAFETGYSTGQEGVHTSTRTAPGYRPVQHKGGKPAEWAPPGYKAKGKGKKGKAKKEKKPRVRIPQKAAFYEVHKAHGWTKSKIDAAWKKEKKAHAKPAKPIKRGKLTGVIAQIGKVKRKTYMYTDKKGNLKHMPEWAVLGYKSKAALEKAWNDPGDESRFLAERRAALKGKREKAAAAATKRIMEGRDWFSPNEGEVMSFEEWKKMHANKRRKTAKTAKKAKKSKRTAKQIAAAKRNIKKAQAARRGKGRGKSKTQRKQAKRGKAKKGTRRLTKHEIRVRAGKKAARTRARNAKKGTAPKRRKGRKASKKARKGTAKRRRRMARRMTFTMYAKNGRRGARRRLTHRHLFHGRRYRKNLGAGYVSDLADVLKVGAIVVVGYATHRALSALLDEHALSKVGSLQSGNGLKWRGLLSSAIVTAVGVPLTALLAGKTTAKNLVMPIAAGMAASFLHKAITSALLAAENESATKIAGYLSAYPDGTSRAYNGMGAYYSFQPRQVFGRAGQGEFYEVLPQSGFGLDSRQLQQAAAGFGAPLMQAAAGFGGPVMQAAAGMGAEVAQAAAGTGEFVVYGAEGIGEYEEVPVGGVSGFGVDDGVLPTLSQAEYALNVAEAAAGIGDLPTRMTVDPVQNAQPIAGEPGGSRAGILNGGDGIFGG